MIRFIIVLGLSLFPYWVQALVNPTFWASIPFGNEYIGAIKIAAALATFIFLMKVTSKS